MTWQRTRFFSVKRVNYALVSLALAACAIGCGATTSEPHTSPAVVADVTNASKSPSSKSATNEVKSGVDKSVGFVAAALDTKTADDAKNQCRQGMVPIDGRYCIDRYEASLVEIMANGDEKPFSPFAQIADQHVRAVSEPHVYPQGYISANQADRACVGSGKRLCKVGEWQQACRGPDKKKYGYSEERQVGRCNDNGKNPVITLFGFRYDATTMNQPSLNQMEGTLAKTGDHAGCSNGYGVYDMVGNLHEWVADPNGTFYGGYYQDVSSIGHGDGCGYLTTAHEARYHDYSTGFRCCADLLGAEASVSVSPPVTPPAVRAAPKAPAKRAAPKRRK